MQNIYRHIQNIEQIQKHTQHIKTYRNVQGMYKQNTEHIQKYI